MNGIPILSMLTIAMNWWMAPASPPVFHATNILLHALNGVLVYLLARRLLRLGKKSDEDSLPLSEPMAMLAGFLIALHPLATESVNLVIGRTALLSATFAIGAVLLMLRATDREEGFGVGTLVGAGACFAMSWACDITALFVPGFMLIADWIANGAAMRRRLAVHAAFWAIAIALGAWWMTVTKLDANPYDVMQESPATPSGVEALAFSRGLGLSMNFTPLTIEHDLPPASGYIDLEEPGVNPFLAVTTGAGLGLVALILILVRSPAGLGLAWFLLALLPVAFF
ncbi:MAG: hypothetical protein SGI88_14565, partial [Candidatus Hydrogenedentes bacterium]|nr:hypothetical protein [Candidatus Hydrogenedentota bacterium]